MRATGKDLLDWFRANGFDDYGAIISRDEVLEFLGVEVPEIGTRQDFQRADTEELNAMSVVRDTLLREGKYVKQDGNFYRVLLPSQNAEQIRSYMSVADRKLRRAMTLSQATPVEHKDLHDTTDVRLRMKRESIRDSRLYGHTPSTAATQH